MFQEGKIKSYNTDRGFGFIQQDQSKDLFFHITDLPSRHVEPKIGENVKYIIAEDQGKFKAVNIVRLDLKQDVPISNSVNQTDDEFERNFSPVQSSPHYEANKSNRKSMILTIIGLIVIVILTVVVYGKYQQYQEKKQQHLQELMLQNEKIVQEQRKALGDVTNRGLSEQGKRNLYGTASTDTTDSKVEISQATENYSNQASTRVEKIQFACDGRTHCSQMRSYEEAVFFNSHCPNTKMDGNNDGEPCEKQFGRR